MSQEARLKITKRELKCFYGQNTQDRRPRPVTDLMCLAAAGDRLAIGSGQGWVFVYRSGELTPFFEKQLSDGIRTCSVSFDRTGELLLAATVQGKICLIDLAEGATERVRAEHVHNCQIQAAAIDPDARGKTTLSCAFCDTNGTVWRIRPKSRALFKSGDYEVSEIWKGKGLDTIAWKGDVIAWNTENVGQTAEVRMYRANGNEMIKTVIKPERITGIKYPRCSFVFNGSESLTVLANGSTYEVDLQSGGAPKPVRKGEPVYLMARNGSRMTARLMVIGGSKKATFEITRADGEACKDMIAGEFDESKQMALQPAGREGFYVMFTDQVYYVKILSNDEKVDYYLSIDNIEQCLANFREITRDGDKTDDQRRQLLTKILEHLQKKGDDAKMAEVCKEFATGSDWEMLIQYFRELGKFEVIAGIVPLGDVQLDKGVVTDILQVLIRRNEERFLEVFDKLGRDSFMAVKLVGDVQRRYEDNRNFAGPLMTIEHMLGEHEKAFRTALEMRYPKFFDDIVRFEQYKFLLNEHNLKQIMEKYPDTFAEFLMQHVEQLDPSIILGLMNSVLGDVYKRMEVSPETAEADLKVIEQFKLGYLDKLRQIDHPVLLEERWGTELAIMYIKFNSPKTMEYLQTSASFKLMPVREAAEEHGMYKEAAFLCQKAGDLAGGMSIYLEHIQDPQEALQFAKDCDKGGNKDKEMWKLLTTYSYTHPEFLRAMLMDLPNLKIKPVKFIKGIPDTNIIPDFEQLAARTVKEYKRKERTLELAQQIVATDAFGAFSRRLEQYKSGKLTHF